MIAPVVTIPLDVRNQIAKVEKAISANPERMQAGFKQAGVVGMSFVQKAFNAKSSRAKGGWKELSPVTVLLRRKGNGGKIKDEADLNAKRKNVQIMRDTGIGQRSFSLSTQNGTGMIEAQKNGVVFGSPVKYMRDQHAGFESTFHFDKEKRERFFQNVQVLVPNPRRTTSKSKRKLKAKVWSEFAFGMFRMLKSMDGKSYHVPARPIFEFSELDQEQMKRMMAPVERAVNASFGIKNGR